MRKSNLEINGSFELHLSGVVVKVNMSTRPGGNGRIAWSELDEAQKNVYLKHQKQDVIFRDGKPTAVYENESVEQILCLDLEDLSREHLLLAFANECKVRFQDKFIRKGYNLTIDGERVKIEGDIVEWMKKNSKIEIRARDLFKTFQVERAGKLDFTEVIRLSKLENGEELFEKALERSKLDEDIGKELRQAFLILRKKNK
jgi:hypothetical protein